MYRCESWTIKKAEHWRIDTFELWCWRRLLRVPWTAGRSNQSILKEINPEYSLEGLMLKFQYFGHLMRRTGSLEKTLKLERLKAGREGDDRGWDRWLDGITDLMDLSLSSSGSWWWIGRPGNPPYPSIGCNPCNPWGDKESDTTEWLNWTELKLIFSCLMSLDF